MIYLLECFEDSAKDPLPRSEPTKREQNQEVSDQNISSTATGVELENVTWSAEHMGFFTH